jgi:hypothetical protein
VIFASSGWLSEDMSELAEVTKMNEGRDDQSRGSDDVLTFSNIIIHSLLLSKNDVKQ